MVVAISIVAGIGLVAAIVLAIADRCLAVEEDPRIGMVTAELPGANCGGCGFAGCDGYLHVGLLTHKNAYGVDFGFNAYLC